MPRTRPAEKVFTVKDTTTKPIEPFASAEEAWFWYMRCEKAKMEGAKGPDANPVTVPPCEPLDIIRWCEQLWKQGRLDPLHFDVMGEYGYLERRPDPHLSDEEFLDFVIWVHAFHLIEPTLIDKGVVQ